MLRIDPVCPAIAAAFSRRNVRAYLPQAVQAKEPMFRRSGTSFDLKNIREYQGSDDPRSIDWRLLARTERAYVKEFHEEAGEGVAMLLDVSASMELGARESYGILVLSLAWLLLRLGIGVDIASFDEGCSPRLLRLGRRADTRALALALEGLAFGGRTDIARAVASFRGRTSYRRLFLFSDFMDARYEPRRHRFPDTYLFHIRRPFASLAPPEAELEIEDPESGALLRLPWDGGEAARYAAAEAALRTRLASAPKTGYWLLDPDTGREEIYWQVLERLHA